MNNLERFTFKKLEEKLTKEYDDFIEELKIKTPEEIINLSYEIATKQDILELIAPSDFTYHQIRALSKAEKPLEELYYGWQDTYVNLDNSALIDSMKITADDLNKNLMAKIKGDR